MNQLKMKHTFILPFFFLIFTLISCNEAVTPKPDGFLRLEYPEAHYEYYAESQCGFKFEKNRIATIVPEGNCAFKIDYPQMKASIYINYRPVENNLIPLLTDAQKLTYNHTIKPMIFRNRFLNILKKTFTVCFIVCLEMQLPIFSFMLPTVCGIL